jgi:Holliday junction DNA helicase RuvA
MIAQLRGTLAAKSPGEIVVEVGGVGYQVFVSLNAFYELPAAGEPVALEIHTHVREDAILLYGFLDRTEKRMFELLLDVSGIGPRLATGVLSGIPARELIDALAESDVGRLVAIPGVGRKTAERMTVELKDRVAVLRNGRGEARGGAAVAGPEREAVSALVNLGYRKPEAERAVKDAAARAAGRLEDLIRLALRSLAA